MKSIHRSILPLFVFALLGLTGCFGGDGPKILSSGDGYLPKSGAVPTLEKTEKFRSYSGQDSLVKYMGSYGKLYSQYGADTVHVGRYTLGGEDKRLTVESYVTTSDKAPAGLFHYHRGKKLRNQGSPVQVGADGVLDEKHGGRNLYFYKGRYFFKILYTGDAPVPDLVPLGKAIAARVPGEDAPPRGYEYLDIKGINNKNWWVTPGYTFNYQFLPAGIFAKAPGAGAIAEVFILGHMDDDRAEQSGKDYRSFLQLDGLDYTIKHTRDNRTLWWARDPKQGRVVCTVYGPFLLGILRPETYEKGEALVERLVTRIRMHGALQEEKRRREKLERRQKRQSEKRREEAEAKAAAEKKERESKSIDELLPPPPK